MLSKMFPRRIVLSQKICRRLYSTNLSYRHHLGEEPLRHVTIGKVLEETVQKYGDLDAIVSRHQNRTITYRDLLAESDRLAAGLRTLGLEKHDRVGLWAPNQIEWITTKMACARAGLITVALNPAYQPAEIQFCMNKVRTRAIVCGNKTKRQDYYQHLLAVAPELASCDPGKLKSKAVPSLENVIVLSEDTQQGAYNYKEILDLADANSIKSVQDYQKVIQPDDPCNIQFTSGTTGQPKAALASHFHLVNNSFYIGKRNELNKKHHTICVQVPFFHAYGTVITIMAAVTYGSTMVVPSESYNADRSLDAIKEEKCTIITGTPTMYVDLIHRQQERNEDISPEIAVSGGAICPQHLFEQMLTVLHVKKVKSVYGLTETSAVVFQSLYDDDMTKATTTVGHVGEHIEVKVVDADNNIVPIGTPGQLYVRGYSNILGYWENDHQTRELIGVDGWLKTGDQFILQEDGYGKIVGRLKEMIVRGGENIFPKEIEDFLITHPNILEIHVVGIPHERLGEEVCACVRLKKGTTLTHDDLVQYSKGKMAHFKVPSRLEIVDDFPKTTSGKIQKFKLIEAIQNKKN